MVNKVAIFRTTEKRTELVLLFSFLLLAAIILTFGYFTYQHYEEHLRAEVAREHPDAPDLEEIGGTLQSDASSSASAARSELQTIGYFANR